jgi:uncharacterized protein YecE (DUF72 family)
MQQGTIRAGMGGWTFEPWEGSFYPADLPRKRQLGYASRQVPTVEVNGTYYSTFKPAVFAGWAREAPEGFIFSLKASRFATNRKVLATAEESVARFLASGVAELGEKLGPIVWQFAPTKKFDPADFAAFLALLPPDFAGVKLRHVLEVRHASFAVPEFAALARRHGCAICYAHHHDYPAIADITADFVYARLQKGEDSIPTAYAPADLDGWAARAGEWRAGGHASGLPLADAATLPAKLPRDVFIYFIHEGKVRAPHAAMALMQRLSGEPLRAVA